MTSPSPLPDGFGQLDLSDRTHYSRSAEVHPNCGEYDDVIDRFTEDGSRECFIWVRLSPY